VTKIVIKHHILVIIQDLLANNHSVVTWGLCYKCVKNRKYAVNKISFFSILNLFCLFIQVF